MATKRKSSKENHAQLFNRYIWLVDLIYNRKRITFEEISERWTCSSLNCSGEDFPLRTFHNHRTAIQQMFDIDILCDKRDDYKYFIENSEDMKRGGVRQWLVNTFSVNNLINESHKLKHRILFEQIPSGQSFLTQIVEAMRDSKELELTYQSFHRDSPSTFPIRPYAVKVFRQRWYILAWSVLNERLSTYALDRIQGLYTTDVNFDFPKKFNPEEHYEDCFGIITSDYYATEEVLIKAYGNKAQYLKTLPLHHSQREVEVAEGYTSFSFKIKPTFDFRQELLSHGHEIEVLAPAEFRAEIAEIVKAQNSYYNQ